MSLVKNKSYLWVVLRHDNAISYVLANTPDDWAPIFWQHPDGTAIPGDWAAGFLDAIKLSIEAWAPFLADHETARHLSLILVYCGDANGDDLLPIEPAIREKILGTACALIPESVVAIRTACMPARVAQAKAEAAPKRRPRR